MVGAFGAECFEIGPGAERAAFTPQHRNRRVLVGVEFLERRDELGGGGAVDGVSRLGS